MNDLRNCGQGKCEECGTDGYVWKFYQIGNEFIWLCKPCFREFEKVLKSMLRRITPTNEELRILAKKHPAPQEWYNE